MSNHNNMSVEDEFIGPDPEEEVIDRVAEWKKGNHYTSDGALVKLKDMNEFHLKHSVNKWSGILDVSELQAELERRAKKS